jgi:cobalt-zinc-cadmium efflux system outer membrane protein
MRRVSFCLLVALSVGAPPAFAQEPAPQPGSAPGTAATQSQRFDLSLSEAFEQADLRNPELIAARRNVELSRAEITIAGAIPNPQVAVQSGFGYVYSDQANPSQVGINQLIELGGKRNARLGLATSQVQLAQLQLDALRWSIRSQVRRAYAELAAAEAQARAVEQQVALVQRLVDIARRRFEAGASPQAELLQAQLSLSQTETLRIQALGQIQGARILLATLLGVTVPQEIDVRDKGLFDLSISKTELVPEPSAQLPPVDALLERAYAQRLDLLAANQQITVARERLNVAQSLRTPDLQLSAGYLFTTLSNGQPQGSGAFFGVGVNAPVFYSFQGELARAQVSIDQSNLQVSALRTRIAAEVRTAYQSLLVSRENIRKYQTQLLPSSREVLSLAQESYQVGKTGLASAIIAQQADQQIRSGYLSAVVAYQSAWADLERAVGGPLVL